jgi:hypothetical protein
MKKGSTAAAKENMNFSQQKLTIGLDLGDRNGWYCVVNEAGQIQLERRVRTSAKALREVFGAMPRSRIALETGTHSPWISRLLGELGPRSDRGACAQGASNRGEPQEGRSAGCADSGPAGPNRSPVAVSGEASQRAGASGSNDDSGTSRTGVGRARGWSTRLADWRSLMASGCADAMCAT